MGAKIKLFLLATFACVSISLYNIASAQDPSSGGVSMAMSSGIAVEVTEPNFIMPSPVHVFPTVQQAAEYVNITPQMPKLLPVGFNIQSVITLELSLIHI